MTLNGDVEDIAPGTFRMGNVISHQGENYYTLEEAAAVLMQRAGVDYRSAQTGRYVSKEYADKHPDVTVKETDR